MRGASEPADVIGVDQIVAAVESCGGRVVIHGWKTPLSVTRIEAICALEAFAGSFLYSNVDTEGLLTGLNIDVVKSIAAATTRRLIAAGGIRSMAEVGGRRAARARCRLS